MSAATELQDRIRRGIPLGAAMGCRVAALGDRDIRVEAPLGPNRNVHGTGFAGSLYGLGILAAWGLCAHLVARAGIDAELVVASASIRYRAPVRGDVVCTSHLDAAAAEAFTRRLADAGRAGVEVVVEIGPGPAALLEASMHASRPRSGASRTHPGPRQGPGAA